MIKFGTSGFRAVMGEEFTKESVQRIAYGICKYATEHGIKGGKVVVGFDNRFMSDMYAKWAIEVLACQFDVKFFVNPTLTPLISFETKDCDFGIMITSSHNPYYFNGVKLFGRGAYECVDEITTEIADYANAVKVDNIKKIDYNTALEQGKIQKTVNIDSYKQSLFSFVDMQALKNSKCKVLVNPMHGSATQVLKEVFNDIGLKKIDFMCDTVDPYFDHSSPMPSETNMQKQGEMVVQGKYDFGFAFDGDGDRFSYVDSDGTYYDCSFVAPLVYDYLVGTKKMKGAFVRNYAYTNLVQKIANKYNEQVINAKVGFKNIGDAFAHNDCLLGAETNGLALNGHVTSKDGIIACLLVLEKLSASGKTFAELLKEKQEEFNFKSKVVERAYKIDENKKQQIDKITKTEELFPKEIAGHKAISYVNVEGLKLVFDNDYWCQIRLSGTEPAVRIFAEMPDHAQCDVVLDGLKDFFKLA